MPTPSAGLGLPQIAGTDSPDIPRDINALIARFEANRNVFASKQVLEVGQVGQIRAGRVLTPADFTGMGLSAPLGLWNLSSTADSSGNSRTLTNKGSVPFAPGILGAAGEAAQFSGSTAQAFYIADTGGADPLRLRGGSWGCWFRTAKRNLLQDLIAKGATGVNNYFLRVSASNVLTSNIYDGANTAFPVATGATDICDDRWHFAVVTLDGARNRLYVDGFLDATANAAPLAPTGGPFNIGASYADASIAASNPMFGRIDEAFITNEVLSPDQILNLYCSKFVHTIVDGVGAAAQPQRAVTNVRRRKRGGPMASGDFPIMPARFHNFNAGSLFDGGSSGIQFTLNPGTGVIATVPGADGVKDSAYTFSGAHTGMSATDTGLPAGTAARSYGAWFKTSTSLGQSIIGWGTLGTADARMMTGITPANSGCLSAASGADAGGSSPYVADGLWHHGVVVEDNAAADAVKRKLYLDGRCVAGSTVLTSLTAVGANAFRVGANPQTGSAPFTGVIDGAFVIAAALTSEQVWNIYNIGSQGLPASPKSEGDHIETFEISRVLARFDSLEGTDFVDMAVLL